MMTRKHFDAIAAAVREVREGKYVAENMDVMIGTTLVARKIAAVCAESNERFNVKRFLRACGV